MAIAQGIPPDQMEERSKDMGMDHEESVCGRFSQTVDGSQTVGSFGTDERE